MWNPYYFNGSDAVHGLASVPNYPASHGCARIPMHIANYFYTLVHQGESVFVVGTPKKAGNGYVGPAPTTTTATTSTTAPKTTTTVEEAAHHADHEEVDGHDGEVGVQADGHHADHDEAPLSPARHGRACGAGRHVPAVHPTCRHSACRRCGAGRYASGSAKGFVPIVGSPNGSASAGRPTVSSSMPSSAAMPS